MDHVWDGFYTGQKRLTKFPVVIQANTGAFHTIEYTGTPPLKQLFELYATEANTDAVKLRLKYTNPDVVIVKKGTTEVARQSLSNGVPAALAGNVCGENRWIHGVNQLEFTLLASPACTINLETTQSIALSFRIDMTVSDFFANDGETQFIDRMAAALNIPQSRIRIVGVYAGSVVVVSQIEADSAITDETAQINEIETVAATLQTQSNAGTLLGDWNVLDISIQVNSYPGGVISQNIPIIQPETSMSITGLVVVIVIGIALLTVVALLLMFFMNRKKIKYGGLNSVVFKKSSTNKVQQGF